MKTYVLIILFGLLFSSEKSDTTKTKRYESRLDSVCYQIHLKDSLETERVKRLCDSVILILQQNDNR